MWQKVAFVCVLLIALATIGVYIGFGQFKDRFISKSYNVCSDSDFQHVLLPSGFLIKLHYLLHIADEILTAANVRYFSIGGTLLSIERTGYLTPWDDDGDLGLLKEDFVANEKKIQTLIDQHRVYLRDPFKLADLGVFQLCLREDHPIHLEYPTDEQPFVDWMLYCCQNMQQVRENGAEPIYNFASTRQQAIFPRSYILHSELFPLQRKPLKAFSDHRAAQSNASGAPRNYETRLVTANKTLPMLAREYGKADAPDSWKTEFLASSHRSGYLFVKPCKLTREQVMAL